MVKGIPQLFQFHKGTIKTGVTSDILIGNVNFNSIKVRLKQNGKERRNKKEEISIP